MCINEGVQENDEMMKVIISTSLQRHQKLNRKLLATALDTKILGSTRTYVNFLHTSEPGKKVDESECSVLFRCEAYQGLHPKYPLLELQNGIICHHEMTKKIFMKLYGIISRIYC